MSDFLTVLSALIRDSFSCPIWGMAAPVLIALFAWGVVRLTIKGG